MGLGAAAVAIFTTAADVTGATAALLNAGLGLFILPKLRRNARRSSARRPKPCASGLAAW